MSLYHKKLVSTMNKSMMICRMSAIAPMIQIGLRFLSNRIIGMRTPIAIGVSIRWVNAW